MDSHAGLDPHPKSAGRRQMEKSAALIFHQLQTTRRHPHHSSPVALPRSRLRPKPQIQPARKSPKRVFGSFERPPPATSAALGKEAPRKWVQKRARILSWGTRSWQACGKHRNCSFFPRRRGQRAHHVPLPLYRSILPESPAWRRRRSAVRAAARLSRALPKLREALSQGGRGALPLRQPGLHSPPPNPSESALLFGSLRPAPRSRSSAPCVRSHRAAAGPMGLRSLVWGETRCLGGSRALLRPFKKLHYIPLGANASELIQTS